MSLKVFADVMSQPARAVVIFCRAAGIQHEHVPLRIANGDTRTPEYSAISPFNKVPVIKDGDFVLSESIAMFRYLAREKEIADHWYPKDSKGQARVDEYLEWQHLNTRINCSMYFLNRWMRPMMKQTAPDEKNVAKLLKTMNKTLDEIEKVWLKDGSKPYIAGDRISVADILAACELEQPSMAGFDVKANRPILSAYMERIKADLNPHYDDVHSAVYKMRDKFGGDIPGIYSSKAKL